MATHAAGAELIRTPMRNDGEGFDVDAILAAINDNTRLVFLANPNNPTGTLIDAAAVDAFLAKVPDHVVVVLDEAYYEFALYFAKLRQFEYSRSLEHLRRGAGVVILRTFSKAHGLAGLRIGYGLGPAELLAYCARMRDTFSVSSVAESAALAALDDHNHIERTVSNNASQAEVLMEGLTKLGYRVVTTWANFLYCDLRQDAFGLSARLRNEGISVRSLGAWGAPTGIRVTIGTPEQNELLLTAVRKIASLSESP
jgi:histidinol-phosphate aminotransferase